jgi:hypothetical protein
MTDLSPAARAVLDAYQFAPIEDELTAAAVLRAAADQLCLRWAELSHPADVLNNIATELEGLQ